MGHRRLTAIKILAAAGAMIMFLPGKIFAAAASYEPARTGSIAIALTDIELPRENVAFSLYQVGELAEENTIAYQLTDDFKHTKVDLNKLQHAQQQHEAAKKLAAEATAVSPIIEGTTDESGNVEFDNLKQGAYLLVQRQRADYGEVEPFLVMLPYTAEDGQTWVYDIKAYPKAVEVDPPEPTPTPSVTPTPTPAATPIPTLTPRNTATPVPVVTPKPSDPPGIAKTGDTSFPVLWGVITAASAVGIGILLIGRKKSKQK